jgi:hypothetical protein
MFTTKINGLLKHSFTSRPFPEWELEIAARPGISMHPRISKLAQIATGTERNLKTITSHSLFL